MGPFEARSSIVNGTQFVQKSVNVTASLTRCCNYAILLPSGIFCIVSSVFLIPWRLQVSAGTIFWGGKKRLQWLKEINFILELESKLSRPVVQGRLISMQPFHCWGRKLHIFYHSGSRCNLLPCFVLLTFHASLLMFAYSEAKYFMRGLGPSLAHAAP